MLSLISSLATNLFIWIWLVAAFLIWLASKDKRRVRYLGIVLLLAVWILGTRPVSEGILWPLESQYQPAAIANLQAQGVNQVVVLTGGGFPLRDDMLSSAFPHASMYRLAGGIELCTKLGPDCKLIFSGSAGRDHSERDTAVTMKDFAVLLQPARAAEAEAQSNSTAEHPNNVRPLVGSQPFILVTSAVHMPRSMSVFTKAGLHPIPYPVDYLVIGGPYQLTDFLPSVENLWNIEAGLHEYFGLIFYAVQG